MVRNQGFDGPVVLRSDELDEVTRSRFVEGLDEGLGTEDAESGRFDQSGCACRQGRPDLAGQTGKRIVEWCDEQGCPVGDFPDQAFGLRSPLEYQFVEGGARGLQERCRVIDLAQCLLGLLAHLLHDEIRQCPPPGHQRCDTLVENFASSFDLLQAVEPTVRDLDRARDFRTRRWLPVMEDAPRVRRKDGQGCRHGLRVLLRLDTAQHPPRIAKIRSSSAIGLPKQRRT